jgi:hypothetical protein
LAGEQGWKPPPLFGQNARMPTTRTDAIPSWPLQTLIGLAATAALVGVAYFLIDEPVAALVRDSGLSHLKYLKWLTRPPEAFVLLSPLVLLAGLIRRLFGPWSRPEAVAVAAAVSTLFTAFAVLLLKIAFGRASPDLVLSGGATYGFRPFSVEGEYWALPSGHTACTVSVTAVLVAVAPRWRLCWRSLAGTVAAALIALNYHYVGDVVAGAWLGWTVGGTAARAFGLVSCASPGLSRSSARKAG